jgi:hypothetical protein
MVTLSDASRDLAGVLLLSLVAVAFGGTFVLRVVRGREPATDIQRAFFRAGHAHAGMFVTLALVCQVLVDATELDGVGEAVARQGVAAAAILIPAGFFLSVARHGATAPNRLIVLLWVGAACLAAGVITLGIGLLTG